jgi:hypothetical protein
MNQTALDYLLSELQNVIEVYKTEWEELDSVVKKAREMEKEQMSECYKEGFFTPFPSDVTFEEYYNKTYGDDT